MVLTALSPRRHSHAQQLFAGDARISLRLCVRPAFYIVSEPICLRLGFQYPFMSIVLPPSSF